MTIKHNVDPIVAEIRKIRESNAARHNFEIRQILADARRRQENSGHPIVAVGSKH